MYFACTPYLFLKSSEQKSVSGIKHINQLSLPEMETNTERCLLISQMNESPNTP